VRARIAKTTEKDDEERQGAAAGDRGQILKLESIKAGQHFTEPPPRYTEATLVKELEEDAFGGLDVCFDLFRECRAQYVKKDQGGSRRRCWASGCACC